MIATKAVMDSLLEHAADVESLAVLSRFRLEFHACLTARGDELFELADAVLCADGPVRTLAGLSLGFYFGHAFFPLRPMPYYPLWPMEPLTPWYFIPWLGIALVAGVCWMKRNDWGRPVAFALAFKCHVYQRFKQLGKVLIGSIPQIK